MFCMKPIILEDPERKCYVCGRTPEMFQHLIDNAFKPLLEEKNQEYTQIREQIRAKVQEFGKQIRKCADEVRKCELLTFSVKMIKKDRRDYIDSIPYLQIVVRFSSGNEESLGMIFERLFAVLSQFNIDGNIEGNLKKILLREESKELEEVQHQIHMINSSKASFNTFISFSDEHFLSLKKGRIVSDWSYDFDHDAQFIRRAFLCPICNQMFENASIAAYQRLHAGNV